MTDRHARWRTWVIAMRPAGARRIIRGTPKERLLGRVAMGYGGCWIWTGGMRTNGYGSFAITYGNYRVAHVASYEIHVGPVPDGLQLDHLCHTRDKSCPGGRCVHRRCINPDHLEPVTSRENNLRSPLNVAAINAAKTRCIRNHEFDEANTRWFVGRNGNMHRECRECLRTKRERAKQAA